jgi:hypothetical protein
MLQIEKMDVSGGRFDSEVHARGQYVVALRMRCSAVCCSLSVRYGFNDEACDFLEGTVNHAIFGKRRVESVSKWRIIFLSATVGAVLFLASCGDKTASGPHATVLMRDGSTLAGMVTATSPSEITLAGDDKVTHTVPMTQVKSIEYDEAQAAQAPAAQTPAAEAPGAQAAAPSTSAAQTSAANSAAPAPPLRRSAASRADDAEHEHHYHPTQAEIHTKTYVLPIGSRVPVRTEETIDSGTAAEGQTYAAEIADDVPDANGDTVVPRGANAQVIIRSATKGNRFHGTSDLVLDLQSISVGGKEYLVSTTDLQQKGRDGFGANKRTAAFTGGGAALGAIIGAIAGGGKGAAIGAGAGAGAGAIGQVATKGGAIKVPAETMLTFQLDKPVQIVAAQ